ncbi:Serine/threonine-protein kinase Rio1 [Mytilinidion resinicola]|uniref:Serine/threonine-protein kinase RIO1 n=1 Tax=Mytilinidion resinicola TaxID=574789 RepID=A0A6A6YFD4_9PEZI|nr:Serine/threonine-protein kinase Rio1 [Mytilinidion resinicola]KAF2807243.1 Serine/threonine-protein kinase Rio1 [Mytilinidion resinicola]
MANDSFSNAKGGVALNTAETTTRSHSQPAVPSETSTTSTPPAPATSEPLAEDASLDNDLDDIFDDTDDDFTAAEALDGANPSDYTKTYNRARKQHDPSIPAGQAPKSNPQKPSANTFASIDDAVASLSKHAGKIKLDDRNGGVGGLSKGGNDKDKSDRATSEQVLDPRTRMILLQMINRGVVSEIHGCLSTGKEANVYFALSIQEPANPGEEPKTLHRAIKVYKTSILVFKDRDKYVTGEFRFKHGWNKSSHRAMVKVWAEKEMRNLKRIYAAGIPCPEPLFLRHHVLVMSFLGDKKGWPAPRLRDVKFEGLTAEEEEAKYRSLYIQLLGYMRQMYQICKLVHADLSEYNLLYHEGKLVVIDVSQSVEHDHPRSLEFLRMDVKNVSDFFRNQNVDTLSDRAVFGFVTEEGATEVEAMEKRIEELYKIRAETEEGKNEEVDNEVFRQQYIPQTLEQVYDIERDAELVGKGDGEGLIYQGLLADKVAPKTGDDVSEEGSGEDGSSSDEDGDREWVEKDSTPRGKRFVDKDTKKDHKAAVKEEKREKRKTKIPKHLKNKLVKSTARKH